VYIQVTACFVVSHCLSWAANFTDTMFTKQELAMNTLHKVKSIKTTQAYARFVQITKSSQDPKYSTLLF
jgi:hypothetical protein